MKDAVMFVRSFLKKRKQAQSFPYLWIYDYNILEVNKCSGSTT